MGIVVSWILSHTRTIVYEQDEFGEQEAKVDKVSGRYVL